MTIGMVIVLSGFMFMSANALSSTVNSKGYAQSRNIGMFCLFVGILLEVLKV